MFKELGAFIDAAGEYSAEKLKQSARVIKQSLSGKEHGGPFPEQRVDFDHIKINLSYKQLSKDAIVGPYMDEDNE